MQEIAFATDSQLKSIAKAKAGYEYSTSPKRKNEHNFATMLPIADSFLVGAGTKGHIGKKIVTGGRQLKDWGIFLLVTDLYSKVVDKVVSKSETLQNFREESPLAFGFANAVLGVTVGINGIKAVNKIGKKYVMPMLPDNVKSFFKDFSKNVNKSNIGKSINTNIKKFANRYPSIAKAGRIVSMWAMPVVCAGILISMVSDIIKAKKTEKETYNKLSDLRLEAAQSMATQNIEE